MPSDRRNQSKKRPPASIKITPRSLKGRCFICGATTHAKDECTKKGLAKCSTCGKDNHFPNDCLAEYIKWSQANFPRRNDKRTTKANKAAAEPPSTDGSEEESSDE